MTDPTPSASTPPRGASPLVWAAVGLAAAAIGVGASVYLRGAPPGGGGATAEVDRLLEAGRETARTTGVAEALPTFEEAYRLAPEDPITNAAFGRALLELNRFAEALPYLRRAQELVPDEAQNHVAVARCLLGLERLEEGQAALEEALRRDPAQPDALSGLGYLALRRGEPAAAVPYYERYLAGRQDAFSLKCYAAALEAVDRPADAVAALTSLVALDPGDVQAQRDLRGMQLQQQGFAATLAAAAARAEAPGATAADLYVHGWLLGQQPEGAAGARGRFQAALERDPRAVWPRLGLAQEDALDGQIEPARARLRELLMEQPRLDPARLQLARLEHQAGRYPEAETLYDQLARGGAGPEALDGLLACYLEQGKLERARALVEDLVRGAPPGSPILGLAARLRLEQGQLAEAAALLEEIAAALGDRPVAAAYLRRAGQAQLEAGQGEQARALFERALALATGRGGRATADLLLWAGVARAGADPAGALELWRKGAETGQDFGGEAIHRRACGLLAGTVEPAAFQAAVRLGGWAEANDAAFVEGLAHERGGDPAAARAAYERAVAASRGSEFPARLAAQAVARLGG